MKHLKIFTIAIIALISIFSFSSCRKVVGGGAVISETRNVSNFSIIRNDLSADVEIVRGNEYNIVIEAQENIIELIETNVIGNVLLLKVKNKTNISNTRKIKIYITLPKVEGVVISGSGNVWAKGSYHSDDISLEVSGSGNITVDELSAKSVYTRISGSGNIAIEEGSGKDLELKISGSGNYQGADFVTEKGDITISGSGDAYINVTDYLKVKIPGSGNVKYNGSPDIDVNISGSGKLTKL